MSDLSVGRVLELRVSDLTVEGGAIARDGELVIFLDRGLPGALVRAEVAGLKARFAQAVVLEEIQASPHQVEPFCGYFGECGGCAWQNLEYAEQLKWKHNHVAQTLRRIGRVEGLELPSVAASPKVREFRNKMEYSFGADENGGLILGLLRRQSREVIPIEACPLQSPVAGEVLRGVRDWALAHKLRPWDGKYGQLRFLIVREPLHCEEGEQKRLVVEIISSATPPSRESVDALSAALPAGTLFVHSQRRTASAIAQGEKILKRNGPESFTERFGDLSLEVPAQAFLQTNTQAAALLYAKAAELAQVREGEKIWDLYCGVGGLGLCMAGPGNRLAGFEEQRSATKAAAANAARLGLRDFAFVWGDVASSLENPPFVPDLVILDPPRAGLDKKVISQLKRHAPGRIVHVSCNPATLARDVAALAPEYNVAAARVVDLFPHTPHVEAIVRLDKTAK